jgi:hypothetical protein
MSDDFLKYVASRTGSKNDIRRLKQMRTKIVNMIAALDGLIFSWKQQLAKQELDAMLGRRDKQRVGDK